MTGLLKSGPALAGRVRPLAAFGSAAAAPADPERERLRAELARLTAELAARDEAIAALEQAVEAAFGEGEAEGRAAGREEAETARAETVAAIEEAASRALARFGEEIVAMERLAVLVAQTCLDRMLLASEDRAGIVEELIRAQIGLLKAESVVRITVSAADFDPLPEIAGCEVVASTALDPGDCTISLRLGAVEIGIGQQWGSLRAALDVLIDPEGGR